MPWPAPTSTAISGNASAYVAALFLFDGLPYLLLVLRQRGKHQRGSAWRYMAGRWKIGLFGTLASLGSYGIALWAMTRAPVALVAALRETSVPRSSWRASWRRASVDTMPA